jgi:hypothetical protein
VSDAAAPIDRLRRISVYLRDTGYSDHEWFTTALAQYESAARHRLSFDQALGLSLGPGATAWWEIEDDRKRDMMIRAISARHFDGATPRAAALAITAAVERYAAAGWRRHRDFISPPTGLLGTLRGDLFVLLKVRERLSFKIIYAALRVCALKPAISGHTDPATLRTDASEESHASREAKKSA